MSISPEHASILPEVVFHSIFGSYGDDFAILSFMIGKSDWKTRNEMGDGFKAMGEQNPVSVKLIKIQKASKLTSANQTGLLSSSSAQITKRFISPGNRQAQPCVQRRIP